MGKIYKYSAHKKKIQLAKKHLKIGLTSLIIMKQQSNNMFCNSISKILKNYMASITVTLKTVSTNLTICF